VASRTPPIAGPITLDPWTLSWLSEMAEASRSAGTRRGTAELRVGWSTAASEARTKATPNSASNGGAGWRASRNSAAVPAAWPAWVIHSSRRRSTTSASEPAPSANSRVGTSWNRISAAIASVDPVST
jgi:hypothetical protein